MRPRTSALAIALVSLLTLVSVACTSTDVAAPLDAPDAQDIPRLADGKPDFSGIWDKPRAGNIENDGDTCGAGSEGCEQTGTGELPYTDLGLERWNGYKNDWTGYCLPWGYTRAWQTSYPVEIIQTPNRFAVLFESNNIFHTAAMNEEHPADLEQTWMGRSVANWEGDTLVIDTRGFNGKTYVDTAEHPLSPEMVITERLTYLDANRISYHVTWDDPVMYTEPFENDRVFVRMPPGTELYEYWCMENNKDLLEGRLPPLIEQ